MGIEIERKFLVDLAAWVPVDDGTLLVQGYLCSHPDRTVRVRRDGERGVLTIKGPVASDGPDSSSDSSSGHAGSPRPALARAEYEYEIPVADAMALFAMCPPPLVEKRRHVEMYAGKRWEIDVFLGDNAGLVLAELELGSESESFARPPWARAEVSGDPRYYNSYLVAHPFRTW